MINTLKILKEHTNPPAKSQQQWKLFAIVYDVQKGNRKAPVWKGRGKNQDAGMIKMMSNKIPSSEVKKFLNVDPSTLPKYVDGEDRNPNIDKMYGDMKKSKDGSKPKPSSVGPHSKLGDKPVKKGQKRGAAGRPRKSTPRNISKALKKVGNLDKSKSKTAKWLKKRGYSKKHQDKAKKHGHWAGKSAVKDSLETLRPIIVEEIKKVMKEAMSSKKDKSEGSSGGGFGGGGSHPGGEGGGHGGSGQYHGSSGGYRSSSSSSSSSSSGKGKTRGTSNIGKSHYKKKKKKKKKDMKEAMSSTERMRRYNKRHPEKVKQNLKKTQDDRVKRNKSHKDKTKEYGTELMRNKDVHHPNGVNGNGSKVVNKDHGRDRKN